MSSSDTPISRHVVVLYYSGRQLLNPLIWIANIKIHQIQPFSVFFEVHLLNNRGRCVAFLILFSEISKQITTKLYSTDNMTFKCKYVCSTKPGLKKHVNLNTRDGAIPGAPHRV